MNNQYILQENISFPQKGVAGFFHERRRGIGVPVPLFPSSISIEDKYGLKSKIYFDFKWRAEALFGRVRTNPVTRVIYDCWNRMVGEVYGKPAEWSLFIDHTYLNVLAKVSAYLKLCSKIDMGELYSLIDGSYFTSRGICNMSEDDFSMWLSCPEIREHAFSLYYLVLHGLKDYTFSNIREDLFKRVYENIIGQQIRQRSGEYFTPSWLASLITNEAFMFWGDTNNGKIPAVADLSCGTGAFLFHAIKHFSGRGISFEDIAGKVTGMDKNPISSFIARINYLLAGNDIPGFSSKFEVPVRMCDPLIDVCEAGGFDKIGKYDIIVGNPPWVVMRSLKNREYQRFLKKEVFSYGLLSKRDKHLFSQMELATLFFCKCADLYLKDRGIIAFVMPRSVVGSSAHHSRFRKFENPRIKILKIIDLEDVKPLFNIPSCVLIGVKDGSTVYPVVKDRYSGFSGMTLSKPPPSNQSFSKEVTMYSPPHIQLQPSFYHEKFKAGASIFPRSLYYADLLEKKSHTIRLKTSDDIIKISKEPWKTQITSEVDSRFLFASLLAWEIIPFGYVTLRPVVLPVDIRDGKFRVHKVRELESNQFNCSVEWFKRAGEIWRSKRTIRSEKLFPDLSDRLNYNRLLTKQDPARRFCVLYNGTGSNLTSCVVDRSSLPSFNANGTRVNCSNFIADVKTWFFETDSEYEAYYLCAVLNSSIFNDAIKPFQPKGLFGARAIHRNPLLFDLPEFDIKKNLHLELAEKGMKAAVGIKGRFKAINKNLRSYVKQELEEKLCRIDRLVLKMKIKGFEGYGK